MDVSGIIQAWTEELERQAQAFVRHVGTVAEWDRHILQNKHALLQLEAEMTKLGCLGAAEHLRPLQGRAVISIHINLWRCLMSNGATLPEHALWPASHKAAPQGLLGFHKAAAGVS